MLISSATQTDQVAHTLLAALHHVSRQRGVHHGQRVIVDGVEAQLAFDDVVGTAHDATAVGAANSSAFSSATARSSSIANCTFSWGRRRCWRFPAGDTAREYQRAGGRATAVAVQDRLCSDHMRRAVDLHQSQRTFLVEDPANERREAIDFGLTGGLAG